MTMGLKKHETSKKELSLDIEVRGRSENPQQVGGASKLHSNSLENNRKYTGMQTQQELLGMIVKQSKSTRQSETPVDIFRSLDERGGPPAKKIYRLKK